MSALPKYKPNPDYKICPRCKRMLENSEFSKDFKRSDKLKFLCRACNYEQFKTWNYRIGRNKPASENKECPAYLGLYVAETLLSQIFSSVTKMANGNRGYDFVCGKGHMIDVKSSCVYSKEGKYPCWTFKINKNTIADYFACIAFDNRVDLNPMHFWLIPGVAVSSKTTLCILQTQVGKWSQYERPIYKLVAACNRMKTEGSGDICKVDKTGILTELMSRGVIN